MIWLNDNYQCLFWWQNLPLYHDVVLRSISEDDNIKWIQQFVIHKWTLTMFVCVICRRSSSDDYVADMILSYSMSTPRQSNFWNKIPTIQSNVARCDSYLMSMLYDNNHNHNVITTKILLKFDKTIRLFVTHGRLTYQECSRITLN